MSHLRQYQINLKNKIYDAWHADVKRVLGVLPTGAGKTVLTSTIAKEFDGRGVFVAHRGELLAQISLQLARHGIYHDLIVPGSSPLRRKICDSHYYKVGKNYINDRSNWLVASVDTMINKEGDTRWDKLDLMITDEAHHLQRDNKWGKVFNFARPDIKLLGVTATPRRADGKALDVFDTLIEGVGMRQLINEGYLTDYQILCPQTKDLRLENVKVSTATGDYSAYDLKKTMKNSSCIVGDVVREYLTHARGKLGVTFAVDVDEATKIAREFKSAGVPAEVVSAKTPLLVRDNILRRFEKREILQLVNVDLFGEGFDLPAIEVVSMARPTMSFSLFVQQFGRVLRLLIDPFLMEIWDTLDVHTRVELIRESKKPVALIIDHVGNVVKHGLPDTYQKWSLDSRIKTTSDDLGEKPIPIRSCVSCFKVYERVKVICPYCGVPPPLPQGRTTPDLVDGDLQLLTFETLSQMRAAVNKVDGDCRFPRNIEPYVKTSILRQHMARQEKQKELRDQIAIWAGKHNAYSERENHKRFYLLFDISLLDALALNVNDAQDLIERIKLTI